MCYVDKELDQDTVSSQTKPSSEILIDNISDMLLDGNNTAKYSSSWLFLAPLKQTSDGALKIQTEFPSRF